MKTHYRQRLERGHVSTDSPIVADLHVDVAGAISDRERGEDRKGPQTTDVYMPSELIGFDGYKTIYGELPADYICVRPKT